MQVRAFETYISLKNSTFIVIKKCLFPEGKRQYIEIDNENIWNVLKGME